MVGWRLQRLRVICEYQNLNSNHFLGTKIKDLYIASAYLLTQSALRKYILSTGSSLIPLKVSLNSVELIVLSRRYWGLTDCQSEGEI